MQLSRLMPENRKRESVCEQAWIKYGQHSSRDSRKDFLGWLKSIKCGCNLCNQSFQIKQTRFHSFSPSTMPGFLAFLASSFSQNSYIPEVITSPFQLQFLSKDTSNSNIAYSSIREFVAAKCPSLSKPYIPPWWLFR